MRFEKSPTLVAQPGQSWSDPASWYRASRTAAATAASRSQSATLQPLYAVVARPQIRAHPLFAVSCRGGSRARAGGGREVTIISAQVESELIKPL